MSPRNPLPIEWTETASEDLEGIADYLLGERLPFDTVEDYVKRIYTAPQHLATLPGAGKPGRVPDTREWLVQDTPYALIYDLPPGRVRVLRVMHSSRQFPEQ